MVTRRCYNYRPSHCRYNPNHMSLTITPRRGGGYEGYEGAIGVTMRLRGRDGATDEERRALRICSVRFGDDDHAGRIDDGDTCVRCMFNTTYIIQDMRARVLRGPAPTPPRAAPVPRAPARTSRVLPACNARDPPYAMRARTLRPIADLGTNCIAVRARWRPVSARPCGSVISNGRHAGYPITSLNSWSTSAQLASWFTSRSARHAHAHHPRAHANHHTRQHTTTPHRPTNQHTTSRVPAR